MLFCLLMLYTWHTGAFVRAAGAHPTGPTRKPNGQTRGLRPKSPISKGPESARRSLRPPAALLSRLVSCLFSAMSRQHCFKTDRFCHLSSQNATQRFLVVMTELQRLKLAHRMCSIQIQVACTKHLPYRTSLRITWALTCSAQHLT